MVVGALALTLVGSAVYGARTGQLAARAERLLALLKLVDGAGSGLDADTVRGLTPERIASLAANDTAPLEAQIVELKDKLATMSFTAQHGAALETRIREVERRLAACLADGAAGNTAALEARIRELETRLASVSLQDDGKTLRFSSVNVQVVSGSGATNGPPNGVGNLIIGYNEHENGVCFDPYDRHSYYCPMSRGGSHNLIVGQGHNYTSFGGIVAGQSNSISAPFASVCGGAFNDAGGLHSSVSGGAHNEARGGASSVTGGFRGRAEADLSWVGGGKDNRARGFAASVSGGEENAADGDSSSVSGGLENRAGGSFSSVSGGIWRVAPAEGNWAAGGLLETGDATSPSGCESRWSCESCSAGTLCQWCPDVGCVAAGTPCDVDEDCD